MNIWLFGEIFFIYVLTFCLLFYSEKLKLSKKYTYIFICIVVIVSINILLVDFDSIKILIFFYLVYLSYTFPSTTAKLFLLILIILTSVNIYINGYGNKLSAIPFVLICSLLPYINGLGHKCSFKMRMICVSFIISELAQGILFDYRGSIILVLFATLFLVVNIKYRKYLVKLFCFLPVIYLAGMILFVAFLALGYDLPVTASNIERSSMVLWGILNFVDFPLMGPGQIVFQMYGGDFKTQYDFSSDIPSDPHSFILGMFILGGGVLAIVSYIFLVIKVIKINKLIAPQYHYYLFSALPLFMTFAMHPFNANSRLAVAVSFGLILSVLKYSKLKLVRNKINQ